MNHETKILYEGKFIRFVSKNGWEYTQRTNCAGIAVIVAVTADRRLLLVQQYRPPVDQDVMELPAGLIDDGMGEPGESGLEAAKRELLEETGYVAEDWRHVFQGPGGPGASADILNFYLALNAKKIQEGGGDSSESIIVHAVALDSVVEWIAGRQADGVPPDPKIYAGLYFLSLYNKDSDFSAGCD
jgi:ADP-ribose pyrophosphatase